MEGFLRPLCVSGSHILSNYSRNGGTDTTGWHCDKTVDFVANTIGAGCNITINIYISGHDQRT